MPQVPPIHLAAASNMPNLFNLIKGASADPANGGELALLKKVDALGRSPLHFSAAKGAAATSGLLLDIGFKPNQLDKQNNTPLHLAGEQLRFRI